MATNPRITLYLDTVSPFAYIAFYILQNDSVFRDCDITYVPIFLGGLMKKCGNTAPINITNKNRWIDRERLLWAKTFNVPMRHAMPPNFPPMTLNIMRCLAALDKAGGPKNQGRLVEALKALYHDLWVDHRETNDPQVLRLLLERVVGGNVAAETIAAAASSEGKDILLRNTDEAFAAGAFGLPWMVCTNSKGETESFWGVDHIGQVADFLGLQRPTKGAWRAVL